MHEHDSVIVTDFGVGYPARFFSRSTCAGNDLQRRLRGASVVHRTALLPGKLVVDFDITIAVGSARHWGADGGSTVGIPKISRLSAIP